MNYLFVLAVVACFGNSMSHGQHKHTEPFGQYEQECAQEKNVSMAALAEAEDGIFTEQANFNKLNCFAECMFIKLGFFIPGSSAIQMEEVRKQAMKKGGEKYVEIAERCSTKEGLTLCDRTYEMYKCYYIEVNKLEQTNPAADVVGYGKLPVAALVAEAPVLPSFGQLAPGVAQEQAPAAASGPVPADTPVVKPAEIVAVPAIATEDATTVAPAIAPIS